MPGSIDVDFANQGLATINFDHQGSNDFAKQVLIDQNGQLVVVGGGDSSLRALPLIQQMVAANRQTLSLMIWVMFMP